MFTCYYFSLWQIQITVSWAALEIVVPWARVKRGDPFPAMVKPHLVCCVQCWSPQYKRDTDIVERAQLRATRIGDWSITLRGKTEKAGSVQPAVEKVELESQCVEVSECSMQSMQYARLFSVAPSDSTRGNAHKLKQQSFHLKNRKFFFTVRVTKH